MRLFPKNPSVDKNAVKMSTLCTVKKPFLRFSNKTPWKRDPLSTSIETDTNWRQIDFLIPGLEPIEFTSLVSSGYSVVKMINFQFIQSIKAIDSGTVDLFCNKDRE